MSKSGGTIIRHEQISVSGSVYTGPLPPPGELAKYDEALPGLAGRIVEQWEKQTIHRHHIEKIIVENREKALPRGQVCAVIVAIVFAFVTCWCAYVGAYVAASVVGGLDLVGMVVAFTMGRQRQALAVDQRRNDEAGR